MWDFDYMIMLMMIPLTACCVAFNVDEPMNLFYDTILAKSETWLWRENTRVLHYLLCVLVCVCLYICAGINYAARKGQTNWISHPIIIINNITANIVYFLILCFIFLLLLILYSSFPSSTFLFSVYLTTFSESNSILFFSFPVLYICLLDCCCFVRYCHVLLI